MSCDVMRRRLGPSREMRMFTRYGSIGGDELVSKTYWNMDCCISTSWFDVMNGVCVAVYT